MDFGRILTAMVTPFDEHGQIDLDKTDQLIEHLLDNGSDGLVAGGTTGESPTLTKQEKITLFRHIVKTVNNRVPVIAGTGSNDTAASIALTKEVETLGVDGIMLVAPYYNKPNPEGLYQHFAAIARETTLPVMLYNIPGRSVVKMDADTIIRLSEMENIVSVKEASGDLDQVSKIIEHTADDFSVYSGEDSISLPMMSVGADGVVSVASHIAGNEMQDMVHAYQLGETVRAASIHRKLVPIMNGLFAQPSPAPVKTALNMKGIDVGNVRLPLVSLTDSEKDTLKNLLKNIGI
ncbi:4-hydroxy-tetrahydrodipicolinate synthase [Lentibacillus cibarius]|uniref:4-hydroxy-tetrahydrodipicolinate synthase n=1 Tax=Lentibacillus cibarius TaxID=2583219 RepID=A0A5S3QNW6_9BACI|nr:4-hydroxy-tetrahydrodipicolinate synthase [Lentibacillus cibarius]TMN23624.1 4-hydroxy-tetrahydrodipicolinate synthase [Lentibacillus cibarius]